jgi:hypothetical protein
METMSSASGAAELTPDQSAQYKDVIEPPRYGTRETILTMIGVLMVMLLASLDQTTPLYQRS